MKLISLPIFKARHKACLMFFHCDVNEITDITSLDDYKTEVTVVVDNIVKKVIVPWPIEKTEEKIREQVDG